MKNKLNQIKEEFLQKLDEIKDLESLKTLEETYLSRKSIFNSLIESCR